MIRLWPRAWWLRSLAPALVASVALFGSLERAARTVAAERFLDQPFWFGAAAIHAATDPPDVIVLGSSRVAMAVVEDRLAAALQRAAGHPVRVVDLGLGYSTWVEHTLGLRRLVEAAPGRLRGTLVLLEAPSGRPPLGSWGQWYHPFSPGLLRMVLRRSDLGTLWLSPDRFDRKVAATIDWAGEGSALIRHRRVLRDEALGRLIARFFGERRQGGGATTAVGGMKAGVLNLQNTRLRTVLQGIGLGKTAGPDEPAPTETLVAEARAAGLVPLLLHVPEFPNRWDYGGYPEATHAPGVGRLGTVDLIDPGLRLAPPDFSDGVHVTRETAERFTEALARQLAPRLRRAAGGGGGL